MILNKNTVEINTKNNSEKEEIKDKQKKLLKIKETKTYIRRDKKRR